MYKMFCFDFHSLTSFSNLNHKHGLQFEIQTKLYSKIEIQILILLIMIWLNMFFRHTFT